MYHPVGVAVDPTANVPRRLSTEVAPRRLSGEPQPAIMSRPKAGGVAAVQRRVRRAESVHVFAARTVDGPDGPKVAVFCEKCGGEHHGSNHDPHEHPERSRAVSKEIGDTIWNAVHGPYAAPTLENLQALRDQYEIEAGQKVYLTRESEHSYRGGRLHEGVSRNIRYYLTLEDGEIIHDFQAPPPPPPPPAPLVLEPEPRKKHRHVLRRRKPKSRKYPVQTKKPWDSSGPHGFHEDTRPWADWH